MTAPLLPLMPPTWWTPADQGVVDSFHAEEAREWPAGTMLPDEPGYEGAAIDAFAATLHPRAHDYTCRRCLHWDSKDGNTGFCGGPEQTLVVIHRIQLHWRCRCEQWEPRLAA